MDWQIFYAGNGRIFLIIDDYASRSSLKAWGVLGTNGKLNNYGFKEYTRGSNNTYKSLPWSTSKLSFLDLPSEPNNFLELVMHTKYSLSANKANYNSMIVSQLLNTNACSGIKEAAKEKENIDFVIGGPTLEMWCAAWNRAVDGLDNGYVAIEPDPSKGGYNLKSSVESDRVLTIVGKKYPDNGIPPAPAGFPEYLFFPRLDYYYWLASPAADNFEGYYSVRTVEGDGWSLSYANHTSTSGYCIRPVICLQAGVKLQKNGEKSTEEKIVYDIVT